MLKFLVLLVLLVSCNDPHVNTFIDEGSKITESMSKAPQQLGRVLLAIHDDDHGKRIKELNKKVDDNSNLIQNQIESLFFMLDVLQSAIDNLEFDQDELQTNFTDLQITVTQLQLNTNIVEVIDPCGDHVGNFDEVILRTSDNNFIAYFEHGSKRFLSILPNGNYQTTDNQACNFSIVNAGTPEAELID
jgi:hypothetical protein